MSRIEFKRAGYLVDDPHFGQVRILIDDLDLIELVRRVEAPIDGYESCGGQYAGLPPMAVCLPSQHFLGAPASPVYAYGDRTQILECTCREPGCYPLLCRITCGGGVVSWSDFGFDDLNGPSPRSPHAALGPFEFDAVQYEQALTALGPAG